MNFNKLSYKHLELEKIYTSHSTELLKAILENKAKEKDESINKHLLNKLVMDYAALEKKLNELNQLKNKFLGMAAHDLRNPLTSIRGFSEILLEEENLDDNQREFLGIIFDASENMLTLVNDLLDVSIIESGKLELKFEDVTLKTVFEERIRLLNISVSKKNIKINFTSNSNCPIKCDRNKISQVMDNLLSNAIKFSPINSEISVNISESVNTCIFEVKDNGPGLSPEDFNKLFGDFQKLSAKPTGGEKSTGLGLAISKRIIEAHKGTIRAESEPGKGTSFIFELPKF